jgi:predicted DNA repair protein MutK
MMAGASLLTLLDDIATVLDDIAVMSKVAAKKTAGVLGDDLALNAQQVSGVAAEREIPVVWAVAKGSMKNKAILVPVALLFSAFIPWIIIPMLLMGGLYLCFEGAEKVVEKLFHHQHKAVKEDPVVSGVSIEEHERTKIKGAIRTDFILSAEIIVIVLGTVQGAALLSQIFVVSVIAVVMTIGVYGLVAAIVKLDDLGFYLERKSGGEGILNALGQGFIMFAPKLMKLLAFVGTLAMFLVGGGIVVHNIEWVHHITAVLIEPFSTGTFSSLIEYTLTGLIGLAAGLVVMAIVSIANKVRGQSH